MEVEILDEEEYIDRADEDVPVRRVLVTYRVGNITADSFSIEADKWEKGNKSALVKQAMADVENRRTKKVVV